MSRGKLPDCVRDRNPSQTVPKCPEPKKGDSIFYRYAPIGHHRVALCPGGARGPVFFGGNLQRQDNSRGTRSQTAPGGCPRGLTPPRSTPSRLQPGEAGSGRGRLSYRASQTCSPPTAPPLHEGAAVRTHLLLLPPASRSVSRVW